MMQAFYWNVPVDVTNKNGTWWDNLSSKAADLSAAGFTELWIPPPSKGNWGITDMGYGIFDHYDLGNYNQKGTVETRFGSRVELESMISIMHRNNIKLYADVILNHIYTDQPQSEINPAVKYYVFHEAYTNNSQHVPYPTNEVTWKIANASPGDYYIQIAGYQLNWSANYKQRGYDVFIDWTGVGQHGINTWEYEPNNGNGQYNTFPGSGRVVQGHTDYQNDIDEYKITLTSAHDIIIKLIAKRETSNPWSWKQADQTDGYYPKHIWHNGSDLAPSLEALTNTGISYVFHTGYGEANYSWTFFDFHPSDSFDWLGNGGCCDEVIPNTKWFGNDLNTYSARVQTRLKDWGYWLANVIGFDGFRLDFVRGIQQSFSADWIKNLPLLNGSKRFIVSEYWGVANAIHDWVNTISSYGADSSVFDFPLKFTLTDMCNKDHDKFDMSLLNHAGMVRNNAGKALPGSRVVTFVDNHDSGKQQDKWVSRDWKMAYAYILTHEGRPCIFYSHYYNIPQIEENSGIIIRTPSLQTDIKKLMYLRKNYLGGVISVLSEVGKPYPLSDTHNVYIARRQGNGIRSGAIVVINNDNRKTKGLWVDSSPTGFTNWANTTLCDAFNSNDTIQVQADGRVYLSAPARSYKVWIKKNEYLGLTIP